MVKKVVIVGLGNIGLKYDIDRRKKFTLSHANAFSKNKSFLLIAGIDTKKNLRNIFEKKYNVSSFNTLKECSKSNSPDIVVISNNTPKRLDTLKNIIKYWPSIKIVICEKPLAHNLIEAKKIRSLSKKNNINMYINFFRRSCPGIKILKNKIKNNSLTFPFEGFAIYSRGLINNGSHLINILHYLFGKVESIKVLSRYKSYMHNDYNYSFVLKFKNGSVNFFPSTIKKYYTNSIELKFSNGIIKLDNSLRDIKYHKIIDDKIFKSFKIMDNNYLELNTNYSLCQKYFVDELLKKINNKSASISTIEDGFYTQVILNKIINNKKN
tara:strand:+ start:1494 stop:2465 length:972 start_codon:yes stop_codon:yes gene_type:complete